jgi:hypothetical protein
VLEATEGELEREIWVGDAVASVREVRVSEKASHRGHGGHRGELERGTGFGDAVASVREVSASGKASHRGHGGGTWLGDEIGKLYSAFFGADHDLYAAIELLLVHRLVGRHD